MTILEIAYVGLGIATAIVVFGGSIFLAMAESQRRAEPSPTIPPSPDGPESHDS